MGETIRAQITLTPTESKSLIAKGVVRMDVFRKALRHGIITIHPSTSTAFIMEEIIGKMPEGKIVSGIVTPFGTCFARRALNELETRKQRGKSVSVGSFQPWVIMHGQVKDGIKLCDILEKMGANDIYVKSGNALDCDGNVGVFIASLSGGTIGKAFSVCMAKGINLILPVGLEKLISISIREASKEAGIRKMDYSMGLPIGLLPIVGIVVTELEAIRVLTGATSIPIGAGGVAGAEGSVTLVLKGSCQKVRKTIEIVNSIKGKKLPRIVPSECTTCTRLTCPFRGAPHPLKKSSAFKL